MALLDKLFRRIGRPSLPKLGKVVIITALDPNYCHTKYRVGPLLQVAEAEPTFDGSDYAFLVGEVDPRRYPTRRFPYRTAFAWCRWDYVTPDEEAAWRLG